MIPLGVAELEQLIVPIGLLNQILGVWIAISQMTNRGPRCDNGANASWGRIIHGFFGG